MKSTFLVFLVAFSPDGKILASGSVDQTIKLSNALTGKLQTTLSGQKGFVSCLQFSPDGTLLASGSYDTTVKL